MKYLFTRKNLVREKTGHYLDKVLETVASFRAAMESYFSEGPGGHFGGLIEETHRLESLADDIRRSIELEMYEKSLIPESRGDILGLLEAVDEIPNNAQSVLYQVETQQIGIPAELGPDFMSLVDHNILAVEAALGGFRRLFEDLSAIRGASREVDRLESSSDRRERELIRKIFRSGHDPFLKILLKELVVQIGNLSDRSEDVTDRLNIVSAKRMV